MQYLSIKKIFLCFMMGQSLFMYACDAEEGTVGQNATVVQEECVVMTLNSSGSQTDAELKTSCFNNCKDRLKWMGLLSVLVVSGYVFFEYHPCDNRLGQSKKDCLDTLEAPMDSARYNQTTINNITKPIFVGKTTRLLGHKNYSSKNQIRRQNRLK